MSKTDIFFYHTNDLHSHFTSWPHIAGYLKSNKRSHQAKEETVFVFDIGDHADRSHPLTEATNGKANVKLLNEAGYNSVTIGNNEGITFPKEQLNQLYGDATFSVLVANILDEEGLIPFWAKEFEILQGEHDIKVGVIGLTASFQPFYQKLGWEVLDPYTVLPELVDKVKQQADIVVLLSHLGWNHDQRIAKEYKDIDIILGAHTHHLFEEGMRINNTYIGQTGKFGLFVGKVKVTYDMSKKAIDSIEMGVMESKNSPASIETSALLNTLHRKKDVVMGEVLAVLKQDLDVDWFDNSPALDLVATALKEWCQTELSMVNAGVLLEGLKAGNITKADLLRICPHPINPCIVTVTGEQLEQIISLASTKEMKHFELKGLGFRGKVLGQMIYDGIEIISGKGPQGEETKEIFVLHAPLDKQKLYKIATLDMFTFGKLYPVLADVEKEYFMPELLRDVLAWKLKQL